MHFASSPSYTTLMPASTRPRPARSPPRSTPGIGYQLQNSGTAVAVELEPGEPGADRAGHGRPARDRQQQPGFELLDSSQLGAANFQQQVTYQRALEGQLDQTIEQIKGINSATVQLVLPNQQDQLFGDNTRPRPPRCCSRTPARSTRARSRASPSWSPRASRACPTSKVTITDPSGALLWPSSGDSGATGGGLPAKQAAQTSSTTRRWPRQVDAMLA